MSTELIFFLLPVVSVLSSVLGILVFRKISEEKERRKELEKLFLQRLERKKQFDALLEKRDRRRSSLKKRLP